jgi:hypothetical protein
MLVKLKILKMYTHMYTHMSQGDRTNSKQSQLHRGIGQNQGVMGNMNLG